MDAIPSKHKCTIEDLDQVCVCARAYCFCYRSSYIIIVLLVLFMWKSFEPIFREGNVDLYYTFLFWLSTYFQFNND